MEWQERRCECVSGNHVRLKVSVARFLIDSFHKFYSFMNRSNFFHAFIFLCFCYARLKTDEKSRLELYTFDVFAFSSAFIIPKPFDAEK